MDTTGDKRARAYLTFGRLAGPRVITTGSELTHLMGVRREAASEEEGDKRVRDVPPGVAAIADVPTHTWATPQTVPKATSRVKAQTTPETTAPVTTEAKAQTRKVKKRTPISIMLLPAALVACRAGAPAVSSAVGFLRTAFTAKQQQLFSFNFFSFGIVPLGGSLYRDFLIL